MATSIRAAGVRTPSRAAGLVNAARFAWDPIGHFERLRDAQGDFARTRIGWRDLVLLGHPEQVHELFVVKQAHFHKGYTLSRMKVLVGQGLLTSEGELHRAQRRRIQPAFHAREVARHGEVMARFADEAGAVWRDGQEVDVADEMLRLGQRIVAKALFDTDIEAADARQAAAALNEVVRGFHLLLLPLADHLLSLPLPGPARIRRARSTLDRIIGNMIAERRESGDRGDLLSRLLFPAGDADGAAVDETQVRDEAMTIFLAGHDTTGNALAWTWHLLGSNPEVERTWHAELDEVLGGRLPELTDLPRLTFTRRLLKESMRLYPPAWAVGRQALSDVEIGGQRVSRGTVVQCCQWLVHRDGRFYEEPERFRPERWTADFERRLPRGAYFPFGLGSRQCVGEPFAWLAGVLALAGLGRRWRLEPLTDAPVSLQPRITLRAKGGLPMRVRRRS